MITYPSFLGGSLQEALIFDQKKKTFTSNLHLDYAYNFLFRVFIFFGFFFWREGPGVGEACLIVKVQKVR
jgi:hypothetical protein